MPSKPSIYDGAPASYGSISIACEEGSPETEILLKQDKDFEKLPSLPSEVAKTEKPFQLGCDWKGMLAMLSAIVIIWILPCPQAIVDIMQDPEFRKDYPQANVDKSWHLLAIFIGTIVGIMAKPLPLGAIALFSTVIACVTNSLSFKQAFVGFTSSVPWTIVTAMFLSKGFVVCGIGKRLAFHCVALLGKTTFGLTSALVVCELLIAPLIPSIAARVGGIMIPIAKELAISCGSDPKNGTEKKMGSYLFQTLFFTSCCSSAMFLTAMSTNLIVKDFVDSERRGPKKIEANLDFTPWMVGACVPGLFLIASISVFMYFVNPPEVKKSPDAPIQARKKLAEMGPISRDEWIVVFAFALTIGMWMGSPFLEAGFDIGGLRIQVGKEFTVPAAIIGVMIMICANIITWKDCLGDTQAWDTLIWFAILIGLAGELKTTGILPASSQLLADKVSVLGLSWYTSYCLVLVLYFYAHYMFASSAAQASAMFTSLYMVLFTTQVPPQIAAIGFAMCGNLYGCLTPYAIASAPCFVATGYIPSKDFWLYGFLVSPLMLVALLGVGPAWWMCLGYV